jgi:hypothetical protein
MKTIASERSIPPKSHRSEPVPESPISRQLVLPKKQRGTRVVINFPVDVFGKNLDGKIFAEKTTTMTVNAHGAVVSLRTSIDSEKPVLLANPKTGMEAQCRVAFQKDRKDQLEVALDFIKPYPRFWGMNFPPDDWNYAERKLPHSSHKQVLATTESKSTK